MISLRGNKGTRVTPLAAWFLAKFNAQYQRNKELPDEILALLPEQRWPGNVRELENVIRRFVVLSNEDHVHQALLLLLDSESVRRQ